MRKSGQEPRDASIVSTDKPAKLADPLNKTKSLSHNGFLKKIKLVKAVHSFKKGWGKLINRDDEGESVFSRGSMAEEKPDLAEPPRFDEDEIESILGGKRLPSEAQNNRIRAEIKSEVDNAKVIGLSIRSPRSSDIVGVTEDDIVQLFKHKSNWTTSTLKKLASHSKVVAVKKGDTVHTEGDTTKAFYIIFAGKVEIQQSGEKICTRQESDGFGWEALYPRLNRRQTVIAIEDSTLIKFDKSKCTLRAKKWKENYPVQLPWLLKDFAEGQDVISVIRQTELFQHLNDECLRLIAMMSSIDKIATNQVLYEEGSVGEGIFLVLEGRVDVLQSIIPDGDLSPISRASQTTSRKVATLEKGDIFGARTLFDAKKRLATIRAAEDSVISCVTRKQLLWYLELHSEERAYFKKVIDDERAFILQKNHTPLFEMVDRRTLKLMYEKSKALNFEAGDTIFKKDEIGQNMYIIVKGTVDIVDEDGDEILNIVRTLKPGEYFGELCLLHEDKKRALGARVSQCSGATVISLDEAGFHEVFTTDARALAEIEMRVLKEEVRLETILNHPAACKAFEEHMKTEFAEENVEFWSACRSFRNLFALSQDRLATPDVIVEDDAMKQLEKKNLLEFWLSTHNFLGILNSLESEMSVAVNTTEADNDLEVAEKLAESLDIIYKYSKPLQQCVPDDKKPDDKELDVNLARSREACSASPQEITPTNNTKASTSLICYVRRHLGLQIYNSFVKINSPFQTNISDSTRNKIDKLVAKDMFSSTMFMEAQLEVLNLMNCDTLDRFKRGDFFRDLLLEIGAYNQKQNEDPEAFGRAMQSSSQKNMRSSFAGESQHALVGLDNTMVPLTKSNMKITESKRWSLNPGTATDVNNPGTAADVNIDSYEELK